MVGRRERLVLLLLSVLTRSLSLSTAWMSQKPQLQRSQREHDVGINSRGGGAQGTEISDGLVGVGIGRSSSSLDDSHLGSRAGTTATDPSERVCVNNGCSNRRPFLLGQVVCHPAARVWTQRKGLVCLACALHNVGPAVYRAYMIRCYGVVFSSQFFSVVICSVMGISTCDLLNRVITKNGPRHVLDIFDCNNCNNNATIQVLILDVDGTLYGQSSGVEQQVRPRAGLCGNAKAVRNTKIGSAKHTRSTGITK